MMNNPVGIKAEHIVGLENILADAISRIYSTKYYNVWFKKITQEFLQIKSWDRFHPNQELILLLYSRLMEGQDPGLSPPKTLKHFTKENFIS